MLLDDQNKKYRLLAEKLYQKCQEVQAENERCVLRINTIKKLLRRRLRDVELLKRRLDKHNDMWRMLPMVAPHPKRKIEQKRGPKPKVKTGTPADDEPKVKKVRKQRMKKGAQDVTNEVRQLSQPPPQFGEHEQQLILQQQHVQYKQDI